MLKRFAAYFMMIIFICVTVLFAFNQGCNQTVRLQNSQSLESQKSVPSLAPGEMPKSSQVIWDWQLSASNKEIEQQMVGEGGKRFSKGLNLLDIDGFNIEAQTVKKLKEQGIYMVCYLNVGSYEPWRSDSKEYSKDLFLQDDPDWPGEVFLNVKEAFEPNSELAKILRKRIQMCKDKGFDAIEPDNLQNHENTSGTLTEQDQVNFNTWFADQVHEAGMAVFQKNGPDLVMLKDSQGRRMVDVFDGILNESCAKYDECAALAEYVKRGKLALDVEYEESLLKCDLAKKYGFNMMYKDRNLKSPYNVAYRRKSCS